MVLSELKAGDQVKITDLSNINETVRLRLNHLGILEGTEICYKRHMPFGGPCIFNVSGQCVCLRKKDASMIKVKKSS